MATSGYVDMRPVITDPTRGWNVLDLVITNLYNLLLEAGVTDPSESEDGVESIHKTVFANFKFPSVSTYEVHEYYYFRQTEEGNLKFEEWLDSQD